MIECVVDSVRVHEQTKRHVVCLKDDSSGRVLPIWIGPDQAHAISTRLYGLGTERPMTHDLMLDAFAKLGVEIVRVAVTAIVAQAGPGGQGVFHASVFLRSGEREVEIDGRPSDAIALAVRSGAPVFVDDSVFAQSAIAAGAQPPAGEVY